MPEHLLIFGFGLRHARDRLSGDDQHVHRRLWSDVSKCHHLVVLIDNRALDFTRDDLLEQGLAHPAFPVHSTSKANSVSAGSALKHWRK